MSNKDTVSAKETGGWRNAIAKVARTVVKTAKDAAKKVARLVVKTITGTIHQAANSVVFVSLLAVKAIRVALFAVAAALVAVVLSVALALVIAVMAAHKLVRGAGYVLSAPYHLTRPNGAEGVRTDLSLWAKSWRLSYFQCMTPADVVDREMVLARQDEYATAWHLIREANEEIRQVNEERVERTAQADRPQRSKKGRPQPTRGKMPHIKTA